MRVETLHPEHPSGSMPRRWRRAALDGLNRSGVSALCRPLTRGTAVIFMLHRFEDPETGVSGFDSRRLRSILASLRRQRYEFVDLRSVLTNLRESGPPLKRAIAFTIDDGYREQATVAGPVFAEFDCPVTTFVTTGFLDRDLWFWWDRIAYVFATTRRSWIELDVGGARRRYERDPAGGWREVEADFTDACKELPDVTKQAAILSLAAAAEVELPHEAPPAYAPMSWGELRSAERTGMTFGPHTVTHPILSRTTAEQSRDEIALSWNRLGAEARSPVPIFAYPNGQAADFGDREVWTMREIGLEGACVGSPGYTTRRGVRAPGGAFRIPRFALPEDFSYVELLVSGLERLRRLLRGVD